MSQVCSKCAHANPPEAVYCYFDGVILGGHSANGGPVRAGSQPFPNQFVFPNGQACRNFDQLAVACQQNWDAAVELLHQGFLASFLGGIGRSDLALAAKEAARFPDRARGLDQLLAKLPSQVLDAPKLHGEPTDVNLGVLPLGTNRQFELHLYNRGMRLLYGSVVSDCKWLTLGEVPGNPQRLFQFGGDAIIPVQIRGQHLRAGNKQLEGHLVIESNGGSLTVTVRADVPAKPYPGGVLAGATTPRQIAEKAHSAPKEAAALFESGAVARWFTDNGWTYPVQGPSASGVGAVQQFFEALGLSKAPKVEITPLTLRFHGYVGDAATAALEVKSQEKRPVYAHAICDQPWLDVSKTVLSGRSAMVQVVVPRIPARPGEILEARVTVTANGNQRFVVPVSLHISNSTLAFHQGQETAAQIPVAQLTMAQPLPAPLIPVVRGEPVIPMAYSASLGTAVAPVPGRTAPPPLPAFVPIPGAPTRLPPAPVPAKTPAVLQLALLAIPALLLGFFLLLLLVHDFFFSAVAGEDNIPIDTANPRVAVYFDGTGTDSGGAALLQSMRFGVIEPGTEPRRLTYDKYGRTNSTILRIDGKDVPFGGPAGRWIGDMQQNSGLYGGKKSVWLYTDSRGQTKVQVQVTQLVELIPGEPVEDPRNKSKLKRYLDTVRVRYLIENKGSDDAQVGLRMLLDTMIGDNDGVPFTVPGRSGLVGKMAEFPTAKEVPDFIQVLENADLKNPGVVAFLNLKLGGTVEPPSRVLLTQWPGRTMPLDRWEIPLRPFNGADPEPDSAVVMYWNEQPVKAGATREVGFSYGRGTLSVSTNKHLGISVGGSFTPGGSMTVVALVNEPAKGETLELKLPHGLKLISDSAKQTVPPVPEGAQAQQSPVTWHIQAEREGTFTFEIISSTNVTQKKSITIKTKTLW
jgi:hypothetical protein